MSRHIARELAFKILFQTDVGRNPWQEVLPRTIAEDNLPEQTRIFLEQLVKGTVQNLKLIDSEITRYAQDWKLERMANTDRNILRMAIYEIKFLDEIPPGVTINEAVELAKLYGDEESGKFVNGILGNMVRTIENKVATIKSDTTMED
jgi:N utilization substance protein B